MFNTKEVPEPTQGQLERYISRGSRQRARQIVESLRQLEQFNKAMKTPVGKEILEDAANILSTTITEMTSTESTPEKRMEAAAEYRALEKVVTEWARKINAYVENMRVISETDEK